MTYDLADIYRDLSAGRLSREQALERIRAAKSGERTSPPAVDTLLAAPVWEAASAAESATSEVALSQHRVLVCGLPQVDLAQLRAALPGSVCEAASVPVGAEPDAAYTAVALAYFEAVRAVLRDKPQGRCCVQLAVADGDDAAMFAGLAGLIETAALEHPGIDGRVLFVPSTIESDGLAVLLRAETREGRERVVRFRERGREARRWRFVDDASGAAEPPCRFRENGVYLITGGLGGLGRLVATEILATVANARVVLCGRAPADAATETALAALGAPGRASYRVADIADGAQTRALIDGILADYGALHGVVHSAGVLRDDFILKKSSAQFADVLRPKVDGAAHLDRATASLPLDFFLLFSSIAAWAGNVGQADYAAANGFLDAFAGWRHARAATGDRRGLSLSIAWPHWLDGGMNVDATSLGLLEKRTGLRSMRTDDGMRALHRCLALGRTHAMAMHGVPDDIRRALEGADAATNPRPSAPPRDAARAAPAPVAPVSMTSSGDDGDLQARVREFLCGEFSKVLKIPAQRIDARAPLEQYGIDSILAMNLTAQLEASFGALPKTLFFEYMTLEELAGYFHRSHTATLSTLFAASTDVAIDASMVPTASAADASAAMTAVRAPLRSRRRRFATVAEAAEASAAFAQEPIAIVGLSGRYPESPDLEAFWRNLRDGKDCIVEVPASRWDWRAWYSADRTVEGAHYSKWGGFIEGVDEFDPRFFNIAPREARTIDPQERLFLQHAWMAVEDAGYTRAALQIADARGLPGQVGVYAGVMYGEYNLSGSLAGIANRVSYVLNLHGPSMTLDTMCSSSLTALHLACQDLRSGRIAMALAGGVNVSVHPNKYTMLSGGQFISGDGHCQSFGEGGDGYIPGEGVGVAVLKRLSDAERDGDHIYGLIRASALNHGGKTNGYTVPNPQAQADVIRRALADARIDPRHVGYIEAHGTGTKLGDPIEIAALTKAFRESGVNGAPGNTAENADKSAADNGYCAIGSAKSNIGHCESAAGIAGVSKVLLQLRHGRIVPSLHSKTLNPHIDFASTPFVVNQTLRAWDRPVVDGRTLPRVAGVSSFGAGGANAHVLIEEYVAPARAAARHDALRAMPLSARTAEQLRQRASDLLAFLEREGDAVDPRDLAHTLQIGREAMDERACFLADSPAALRGALRDFLDGRDTPGRVWRGSAKRQREALAARREDAGFVAERERTLRSGDLAAVGALWAEGEDIDWRRIAGDEAPRRMSLPAYPFARERYWIAPATTTAPHGAQSVALAAATPTRSHPLVHANASDLNEVRYRAEFAADEAPLSDGALPPLLMLEAMRAALALAAPSREGEGAWELQAIAWGAAASEPAPNYGIAALARDADGIDLELYRADDDSVLAQTQARFGRDATPETRDMPRLRAALRPQTSPPPGVVALHAGSDEWLAELRLPDIDARWAACWLTPSTADALQALCALVDGAEVAPLSLRALRAFGPCPAHAFVHLRRDRDGALDVAVYGDDGRARWHLQGLRNAAASDAATPHAAMPHAAPTPIAASAATETLGTTETLDAHRARTPVSPTPNATPAQELERAAPAPATPRELAVARRSAAAPVFGPVLPKPDRIALAPPSAATGAANAPVPPKGRVRLAALDARIAASSDAKDDDVRVRVFEYDHGHLLLRVEHAALADAIDDLSAAITRVRVRIDAGDVRSLRIETPQPEFWSGGREVCDALAANGLYAAMSAVSVPTIAAVAGDLRGAGLLLAALCDFLVLGDDALVGFADASLSPGEAEAALLRERFGAAAQALLDDDRPIRGRALGLSCGFAPAERIDAEARRIAETLNDASPLALGLLKPHLARRLSPLASALVPLSGSDAGVADRAADTSAENEPARATDRPRAYDEIPSGCLCLRLGDGEGRVDPRALSADLRAVFAHAATGDIGCVVVHSALDGFLPPLSDAAASALILEFETLIADCPVPVIAALGAKAEGAAWRFALACDTVVYARDGRYSASALWTTPALSRATVALCASRFEANFGRELTLALGEFDGAAIRARSPGVPVVDDGDTLGEALRLAAHWSRQRREDLHARFRGEHRRFAESCAASAQIAADAFDADAPDAEGIDGDMAVPNATSTLLRTDAVTLSAHPGGVALIEMHDRDARNMFSPALVEGLKRAFDRIASDAALRAVVLTGYDSYFATGGTLETLLAIQDGQARFTDETVFQLPMDCPLPVIAAIQGHGIGGGWSFGMFADLVALSEESRYLSPYMGYGFTPGAGSTLMFPARIGYDLARETLLTAREVSGRALKERGVPLTVSPRREVVADALALAARIAAQPRARLIALKRMFAQPLRDAREDAYAREVAMHARTFVDNADTLRTIRNKFRAQQGDSAETTASAAPGATAAASGVAAPVAALVASQAPAAPLHEPALQESAILDEIRSMLAQELFLDVAEIDDGTPFIQLGLDSITGVTWIRRINAHYGIEIEATKVYSHPDLISLGRLVADAAVAARAGTPSSAVSADGAATRIAPSAPARSSAVSPARSASVAPSVSQAAALASPAPKQGARLAEVVAEIRGLLAAELLLRPDEIEDATPFFEMGLDSITGVTWVRRINARYGIDLEATKVYSHPTLEAMGRLVLNEAVRAGAFADASEAVAQTPSTEAIAASGAAPSVSITASASMTTPASERRVPRPVLVSWRGATVATRARNAATASIASTANAMTAPIAVIGIAGQFPMAGDIDAFWENLAAGRDCIAEVADERWSLTRYYRPGAPRPGKTNSKWLGALADYDRFDPLFFSISPTEAENMDPQQRLFLQACWHAVENAGYAPQSLSGSQCGVFVGCGPSDYHQASHSQRVSAQGFIGAAISILAARISYFLNLRGPSIAMDTACSSSLVAISGACDALNAGTCDLAIAGGVYVMGGPSMHVMTSQAGMLSADGRCYTFDARANGFVPGEAVGAIVLKRLADAERDGDRIQAVVEGWGTNQDGKSNGITAPNEDAQTRLLQSVYRRFGIDPGRIQLIEAHGTGTKLGDPIEIAGLKAAFAPFTDKTDYCALGSVKSNIGHCLTAAGAAGFIKLVLALRECALPPTIHYAQRNEHIRLDGTPFYVNDRLRPWRVADGERRRGAISSFGFSGTNAHLVVAEYASQAATRAVDAVESLSDSQGRSIVPLSARNEAQLREQAERLLAFLRGRDANRPGLRFADIADTLQVGRDPMGERLALLAASTDELIEGLDAFLSGRAMNGRAFRGQIKRDRESLKLVLQDEDVRATLVGKWLSERKFDKLAEMWAKGLDLDWSMFRPQGAPPRRIALPGYPFARERYWLPLEDDAASTTVDAMPDALDGPELSPAESLAASVRLDADVLSHAVRWDEHPLVEAGDASRDHSNVLIVCDSDGFGLDRALRSHYAQRDGVRVSVLPMDELRNAQADRLDALRDRLASFGPLDALYFLAAAREAADAERDATAMCGEDLALLRLMKSIKGSALGGDGLDLWTITVDSRAENASAIRYRGAGVSGLAYSLAQGSHRYRVRNLDLCADDLRDAECAAAVVDAIVREPRAVRGEAVRIRSGRRYRQSFVRIRWDASAPAGLAQGGVYAILGGVGIVGRAITRELLRTYDAHVYWLGRSAADAEKVREALAAFPGAGERLRYLQADALDESELRSAFAHIRERHGRINGAVFSGMVIGDSDEDTIEKVSESAFRSVVEIKVRGSRTFYDALRDEPLDFLCYFSSGQAYAFSGAVRLPAYAAGIVAADSLVRAVAADAPFPVGIVNWGYWRSTVTERIEKMDGVSVRGIEALDDGEGFACFERFVGELRRGRLDQALCMRTTPQVEALMGLDPARLLCLAGSRADIDLRPETIAVDRDRILDRVRAHEAHGLESLFARLLHARLGGMLVDAEVRAPLAVEALREACGILPKYALWLRRSLDVLADAKLIEYADGTLLEWAGEAAPSVAAAELDWRERMDARLNATDIRALVALVDECLDRLPEILRGDLAATDVVFPQGDMEKVAGLYRNNAAADTCNEIVAETVATYVRARLERDPAARIRILEVGAGTGGTSALVFAALAPYRDAVDEYAYTDVSKAFLLHAESAFLPNHPYIVCRRLDIELPLAPQGIETGSYDLLLSTNALHATRNIRWTLRHAKSALRRDGALVISEMCASTLSTHLIFGLLDGWWLFEDAELRIPGCPGLSASAWRRILHDEGFLAAHSLAEETEPLGNRVTIARSDGAFLTTLPAVAPPPTATRPRTPRRQAAPRVSIGKSAAPRMVSRDERIAAARNGVLDAMSATLKIAVDRIDPAMAFSDYGIDSILGATFIDRINARFGMDLNTAIVFEYAAAERLAAHIVDAYASKLDASIVGDARFDEPSSDAFDAEDIETDRIEIDAIDGDTGEADADRAQSTLSSHAPSAVTLDREMRAVLLDCLSKTLKMEVANIDPDVAFSDYGIDSILGVNFVDRVNGRFGVSLNSAIVFEYSSISRLQRHLADAHGEAVRAALRAAASRVGRQTSGIAAAASSVDTAGRRVPASRSAASAIARVERDDVGAAKTGEIAVVGLSGKFPKADTIAEFWRNLVEGVDGVEEFPPNYLDQAIAYSPEKKKGKTRCKWGGILADRDCFDPLFFNISPKEAESMNPHQRLAMQESWNALEDAGYDPRRLAGSRTAVFLGAEPSGYIGDSFTGLSDAIVASRLSYAMDFKGAAFVVNTGCSSSAVAIHLGCENLRSRESDIVLAGGVNACIHQDMLVRLDQIDMLSPSGRCFTFDKAGDGTIISEGVGVAVLKRLDDAIADGDHIYGTICASGMNQDGASNGITAPNGAAQEALIVSVYERFGIDARSISYVEAHGTGTRLGDPVETNALVRAFRRYSDDIGWCAIGSAKSHIGHAAAAAGVIGLIKVLMSMRHRTHPRLLNFRDLNPLVQFEGSPFEVVEARRSWDSSAGRPRMAAINSFGHSGTNAHLVVKEYLPPRASSRPARTGPMPVPLSAKTPEQLRQRAQDLLAHLRESDAPTDLDAIVWTLQMGREAMDERVGFVVDSIAALCASLDAWLADRPLADTYRGRAGRNADLYTPDAAEAPDALLRRWAEQGARIDWSALWGAARPRRVALPGYPFAKERYWKASAFAPTSTTNATPRLEDAAAHGAAPTRGDLALEAILDRIASDQIPTEDGIRLLRALV